MKKLKEEQNLSLQEKLIKYRFAIRHEHDEEKELDKYEIEKDFRKFLDKVRKETAEIYQKRIERLEKELTSLKK